MGSNDARLQSPPMEQLQLDVRADERVAVLTLKHPVFDFAIIDESQN